MVNGVRRPAALAQFLARNGSQLLLNGKPHRFVGINAYQAATVFSTNVGCGTEVRDLASLFGVLPRGSVVRFWAFQAQGFNKNTRQIDFAPIDRVVREAEKYGIKLVMTLGEQAGVCDDGKWHDKAWYQGGYRKVYNDDGRGQNVVSYISWVRMVVKRYRNSPTVGMWELINEPEAANCPVGRTGRACYGHTVCPDGSAEALREFFDVVGAEVKRIDPHHLLSAGTLGQGECGLWQPFWQLVSASPAIDVTTIHDYDPNGISGAVAQRIQQAAELNKPLVLEEVGTDAGPDGVSCMSHQVRRDTFKAKMDLIFSYEQVAGFLPWQWVEQGGGPGCNLEVTPQDPLMGLLGSYQIPEATRR